MACPHGNTRGRCQGCREDALEEYFGDGSQHYTEDDDE